MSACVRGQHPDPKEGEMLHRLPARPASVSQATGRYTGEVTPTHCATTLSGEEAAAEKRGQEGGSRPRTGVVVGGAEEEDRQIKSRCPHFSTCAGTM
jgi:hypothetical protein